MVSVNSIWLVEIRVKDWVGVPKGESRTVAYEEVEAGNEIAARHDGFDKFAKRCKYEPIMRRRFENRGLKITDYCAPDAVEL